VEFLKLKKHYGFGNTIILKKEILLHQTASRFGKPKYIKIKTVVFIEQEIARKPYCFPLSLHILRVIIQYASFKPCSVISILCGLDEI
jgi:hypothetical protein